MLLWRLEGNIIRLGCMNLHFHRITCKDILFVLFLFMCTSVSSQSDFAPVKEEVEHWYSNIESSAIINKALKSIDFSVQHYSVTGKFSKGILSEGTIAKFYDTSSLVPTLLLEGKVSYQATRLVVEGVKYESRSKNKIYGEFYVYNMDDYSMGYKAKKAGDLKIKCTKPTYLEGLYLECPTIVKLSNEGSSIYVDGKTGGRSYTFFSAVIPEIALNDDDSFDLTQILLCAKDDVLICGKDGSQFTGSVKPINNDGAIGFVFLFGQKSGMTSGPKRISVSYQDGNIIYTQEDDDDNQLLSKQALYVRDNGTLSEMDYWNRGKIYENCYLAQWTYRNGNYFEGSIKSVVTADRISSTATRGVFKYPNGDRFEGDVSSKHVDAFFVDGTTFFADGSNAKGNWLENFKLNNDQWAKVYKCKNPSDAKALAEKLMHSNYYQEYKYSGSIDYFNPKEEHPSSTYAHYVTYNKIRKLYTCRYKPTEDIQLRFAVDDKGFRKWEVIYGYNNKPEFLNQYTWYSNGEVESIKSYYYDTKRIYLSCNFFSDGKLRSAYLYGKDRNGEPILRKSKEAHPTFSGYTCKLYDLNGNYERSIDWEIGEWIWGMAPAQIDFRELKPIE